MTGSSGPPIDLLELYKRPIVNQLSGFSAFTKQMNADDLVAGYHSLVDAAPRRHSRGKKYFVGHTGEPNTGARSNRREEHLAMALWNWSDENGPLPLAEAGELTFLDYQFPLKARQGDAGVGKVDLFGVIDGQRPCVVELKIHPHGEGVSDTPLRAFLEALAYCAIVEANARDIEQEALELFGHAFSAQRPELMVMGTEQYWHAYAHHDKAGNWWPTLRRLAERIGEKLGLESHFIALRGASFSMGLNGQKPRLLQDCACMSVADLLP